MQKYYLTTPLYYVNDVPHIGHAYTTVLADVIKRYRQMQGFDVFFLTGTDEHGQKIEKSAAAQNKQPKELADWVVSRFKDLWKSLNIQYDRFIRTTDDYHRKGVEKIWNKVRENGDIYEGEYRGHYCVSCESFVSEVTEENKEEVMECPDCGKKTSMVGEKCYFFRLSAYQDKLLKFYDENPDFIYPKTRMNEVKSFVQMGLRDLSVTRSTVKWGIPVPGDEEQTIYVWFDALSNYINAVHYHLEDDEFNKWWPADLHIMAKDILKFHAVYWPAFLMSAGVPLPKKELIHGWWLKDEKKMSKSVGNVLDPNILLKHFNADAIRFYLMREAPIGADGNFSHQGFIGRINTDLSNDWGNLVSRTTGMIGKYFKGNFSGEGDYTETEIQIRESYLETEKKVTELFNGFLYNRGLEGIFEYISTLNKYIVTTEPWTLAKDDSKRERLAAVMKTLVRGILSVNNLISPVIPETSEKIRKIFRHSATGLGWQDPGEEFKIYPSKEHLFPRVDPEEFFTEDSVQEEEKMEPTENKTEGLIDFDDFMKVQMTVALVVEAEKVEKADRLLQLTVDIGTEKRNLVAGVAQYYEPDDLKGKKIIIVKNLKPAKIRGILSEGMILAATGEEGRPHIPVLPEDTPVGAMLK